MHEEYSGFGIVGAIIFFVILYKLIQKCHNDSEDSDSLIDAEQPTGQSDAHVENNSTPERRIQQHVRNERRQQSVSKKSTKGENKKLKRLILIDGSNVAFGHSLHTNFSVKGLEICINYFKSLGHEVKAIVPRMRLQSKMSTDRSALDKMYKDGIVLLTPSKNLPGKTASSYDDRYILDLAIKLDAVIISNDNYRDLIQESPAFKNVIESRVIGFTWCGDIFTIPKDPYGKNGPTLDFILKTKQKSKKSNVKSGNNQSPTLKV